MYKIQCDKNMSKVIKRFFDILKIDAEISMLSDVHADIAILRSPDETNFNADVIILNSDDKNLLSRIKGCPGKVITCGLATKSTVTFSSISDAGNVMCTQRSFARLDGKILPPFELPFECCGKLFDEVSVLMIITAALLCGADTSQLQKIYL